MFRTVSGPDFESGGSLIRNDIFFDFLDCPVEIFVSFMQKTERHLINIILLF